MHSQSTHPALLFHKLTYRLNTAKYSGIFPPNCLFDSFSSQRSTSTPFSPTQSVVWSRFSTMVQSLYDIALIKCIQLSARITDVGDIPYQLVKPVLKRFNAKQLGIVEENSPSLTPESDELWAALIERDFPDRPAQLKRGLENENEAEMPNKALYLRYCDERESLRASSAQRLRKMTQKLQKEKSKNSIVPLQGIIREPVIRRHTATMGLAPPPYLKYAPKSILGKAMKDMQHRQLMFGATQKKDPYQAFHTRKARNSPRKAPAEPRTPGFLVNKDGPTGIYLHTPIGRPAGPASPQKHNLRSQNESLSPKNGSSSSSETSPNPEARKRKPASIFLTSKRMCRAPRIPPESKQERKEQTRPAMPERLVGQKPVRSSIFH